MIFCFFSAFHFIFGLVRVRVFTLNFDFSIQSGLDHVSIFISICEISDVSSFMCCFHLPSAGGAPALQPTESSAAGIEHEWRWKGLCLISYWSLFSLHWQLDAFVL